MDNTYLGPIEHETHHITNGGAVHRCTHLLGYRATRPDCGTGMVSAGIKRISHFGITNDPVTCHKCLKLMEG